jgi:ribosome assembly protein RRB1
VASFSWHTEPITSVEWHPTDDSCFVASGADNQVTQWDLSVELDDEERPNVVANDKSQEVPPQLLFVHQGQQDVKEVHWHPQIPGCVISTAASGFDVYKSISI